MIQASRWAKEHTFHEQLSPEDWYMNETVAMDILIWDLTPVQMDSSTAGTIIATAVHCIHDSTL